MAATAARIAEVLAGLRDRTTRLGVANTAVLKPIRLGIEAIDEALAGGLPRGRLTELCGPRSSGRMSIAFAALREAQALKELVAFVDVADAFDPRSAHDAGIDLTRLLWVRPRTFEDGLKAADRILDAGGFGVLILYMCGVWASRRSNGWARLVRQAEKAKSAVLVVADTPVVGSFVAAGLESKRARGEWLGEGCAPRILQGASSRVAVTRNKLGPPNAESTLRLDVE